MLDSLHIENIAVISSLDVDLSKGLTVITGETGSGKSVMIDALAFLLGAKPARELLRTGERLAIVSGVFSSVSDECIAFLEDCGIRCDGEVILHREMTAEGRVKNWINGRSATQGTVRDLALFLCNIHGQNDNQTLLQRQTQEKILDGICDLSADLAAYSNVYAAIKKAKASLLALKQDAAAANRLRDVLAFQIDEIERAKLRVGEEEELLERRTKLQNAERIAKQSEFAYHVLLGSEKGSAALILERAAAALTGLSGVIPEAAELGAKLDEMRYEVVDVAERARDVTADVDGDPSKAHDRVESRLDTITKLRRKYGEDEAAILAFLEDAKRQLFALENSEEEEKRLQKEINALDKELKALAKRMHTARVTAAAELDRRVEAELAYLDMPSVRFSISVEETDTYTAKGNDLIEFRIATNKGEPLAPLSRIASGGELSRIMLALRAVLNDRDGVGTAVFDEVDTGISGKTARKIGIKLAEIGKKTQVLAITHAAQIASLATSHLKIAKTEQEGRAVSTLTPLDEAGRVAEVARILGGISVTETQENAARELIEEGRAYR